MLDVFEFVAALAGFAAMLVYFPPLFAGFWLSQNRDLVDKRASLLPGEEPIEAQRRLIEAVLYDSGARLGTLIVVLAAMIIPSIAVLT